MFPTLRIAARHFCRRPYVQMAGSFAFRGPAREESCGQSFDFCLWGVEEDVIYQLNWQTLPGLKGLSCSNFRAAATHSPDSERGVAFQCASEAECADLMLKLEAHFGAQRFSNNAAAFEAVKAYVLEWSARQS